MLVVGLGLRVDNRLASGRPPTLTALPLITASKSGLRWAISQQSSNWAIRVGAMRIRVLLSGPAVAAGGLALSLTAGAGVASADPDLTPIINSTCTYTQWTAALHAQNPDAASVFDAQPASQSFVRQFIASPPDQRASMAQMVMSMPGSDQNLPIIQQAFSACNNY